MNPILFPTGSTLVYSEIIKKNLPFVHGNAYLPMHRKDSELLFTNQSVNQEILRERAFNLRWAMVPEGVIPLTAADPDFPCAPCIREAIKEFTASGYFCYGPPEGYLFFRESVSRFFLDKRNIRYAPEYILAVDSAAAGIFMTCQAFLNPGDEAIVFDPVDFLFRHSIEKIGAKALSFPVPSEPRGEMDFDFLETLAGPKTRLICVCNPLNPTGKVLTEYELKKLIDFAERHQLMILSDEIWSDIVFSPAQYISIASLGKTAYERTITITGFSKSYGLAGLRVGTVLAPDEKLFRKILAASAQESTIHGCNSLGQVAAAAALNEGGPWLEEFLKHLQKMRDITVSSLNSIPGISCPSPDGCYLVFPDIRNTGYTAAELQEKLMKEAKVAVVPGLPRWFGNQSEGHIRICFATSEHILKEALNRVSNYFAEKK